MRSRSLSLERCQVERQGHKGQRYCDWMMWGLLHVGLVNQMWMMQGLLHVGLVNQMWMM